MLLRRLDLGSAVTLLVMSTVHASGVDTLVAAEVTNERRKSETEGEYDPIECFETIDRTIRTEFWDPTLGGLDWEDVRNRYRSKALAATDHESFASIVNQMLGELKTSHTRYLTRWDPAYYGLQAVFKSAVLADASADSISVLEQYLADLRVSRSEPRRSGIGVVTEKMDDRYFVKAVLPSSPAEMAGIVLGDQLVTADGKAFHPIRSFEGKAGREVQLTVQTEVSESSRKSVRVTPIDSNERELFESASRDSVRIVEYNGRRFAYARLWWLTGPAMRGAFESGLSIAEASEGMILDIRDGFGGGPATEYIHPFLAGGLEEITVETIGRNQGRRSTVGFDKPLIVLINRGSRSGKELLAYCFKKTGAGVLLGERTAGHVCGGRKKRVSQDSILYYCTCMLVIDGKRLEGVGVEPDVHVPFDVRFAGGRDAQLDRAKDEMVKLLEMAS